MALRDELKAFAANAAVPVLAVPTPELPKWDGQIFVTRTSPRELAVCWQDSDDEDDKLDTRAAFVALVACDQAGSRIFQAEDVEWLATTRLLSPVVERLYWAGLHCNGLTDESRTAWRKNSTGTGGGGSPSSCAAPCKQDSAST